MSLDDVMFGAIFNIMDNFIGWLYTEAVLPRIAKCTSQVMALIDPALALVATVGQDEGFSIQLTDRAFPLDICCYTLKRQT